MSDDGGAAFKPMVALQRIATGHHVLSRAIPPALLLFDALLCVVIIKKVPCLFLTHPQVLLLLHQNPPKNKKTSPN